MGRRKCRYMKNRVKEENKKSTKENNNRKNEEK